MCCFQFALMDVLPGNSMQQMQAANKNRVREKRSAELEIVLYIKD